MEKMEKVPTFDNAFVFYANRRDERMSVHKSE